MEPARAFTQCVAEVVRDHMDQASVSQESLAGVVGVTRQSINRKLGGHTQFTVDEIETIARHFDLPVSALFYQAEVVAA